MPMGMYQSDWEIRSVTSSIAYGCTARCSVRKLVRVIITFPLTWTTRSHPLPLTHSLSLTPSLPLTLSLTHTHSLTLTRSLSLTHSHTPHSHHSLTPLCMQIHTQTHPPSPLHHSHTSSSLVAFLCSI